MKISDVEAIICNWCTARRTLGAVRSLRKYYPDLPIVIVDDASEKSAGLFHSFYEDGYGKRIFDLDNSKLKKVKNITFVQNDWHMEHGLSLSQGVKASAKPFVWFFDSDARLLKEGQLEKMLEPMGDKKVYGTGYAEGHQGAFLHPVCSLWRKEYIDKYQLNFDENDIFSITSEKWENMTTCQLANYQMMRKGYKRVDLLPEFIHLTGYIKGKWEKYF